MYKYYYFKKNFILKFIISFISIFLYFLINLNFIFALNGIGTSLNPYEISSCLELNEIRNLSGNSFILVNNVDCSDTINWVNSYGTGFEPIGNNSNLFFGEIDGNGFTISNLFINISSENVSLFEKVTSFNLYDLTLENLFINSVVVNNVDGIIGDCSALCNISNINLLYSSNEDTTLVIDNLIGNHLNITNNILGLNVIGTTDWVSNSVLNLNFSKNSVKIVNIIMDLSNTVLDMSDVVFNEVLNMSEHTLLVSGFNLQGSDSAVLYFKLHNSLTFLDEVCVKNSHSISSLDFSYNCTNSDEFLFSNLSNLAEFESKINSNIILTWEDYDKSILKIAGLSYFLVKQSLMNPPESVESPESVDSDLPTSEFNLQGSGTYTNPFKIFSCGDLNQVRLDLSSTYLLEMNVDCSGTYFVPIGNSSNKFTGVFLGNKNKISNLYIIGTDYLGLFGAVENSDISNLYLSNVKVIGSDNVGALSGSVSDTEIKNIIVTGSIRGNDNVAGVVGFSYNTDIYNSYFDGSVSGENNVAGIIGKNNGGIYNSFSVVGLSAQSNYDVIGVGGIFENNYWLDITSNSDSTSTGIKIVDENYFNYRNKPMDVWDSDVWNWEFDKLPNFEFSDEDSDGVKDVLDKLVGDDDDIDTNVFGLDIEMSGNFNWNQNSDLTLYFSENDGTKIVDTKKDLSIYPFYMENIVIELENISTRNSLLLKGFDLKNDETKTIYFKFLDDENFNENICIKDEEVNSINTVSESCNGDNEYLFEDVKTMSSSSSKTVSHIDISWENYGIRLLKIEGLNNSAVVQFDNSNDDYNYDLDNVPINNIDNNNSPILYSSTSSGLVNITTINQSDNGSDVISTSNNSSDSVAPKDVVKTISTEPLVDNTIIDSSDDILEITNNSTYNSTNINESGFSCEWLNCRIWIIGGTIFLLW